jgi:transposase
MIFPEIGQVRVFLRPGATDMRKSINGLSATAAEHMRADPLGGNLFVFCNRKRSHIKILYWDRNGFCLWLKRLERDRFQWPRTTSECLEITSEQMGWLLRGLDMHAAHAALHYSRVI